MQRKNTLLMQRDGTFILDFDRVEWLNENDIYRRINAPGRLSVNQGDCHLSIQFDNHNHYPLPTARVKPLEKFMRPAIMGAGFTLSLMGAWMLWA